MSAVVVLTRWEMEIQSVIQGLTRDVHRKERGRGYG